MEKNKSMTTIEDTMTTKSVIMKHTNQFSRRLIKSSEGIDEAEVEEASEGGRGRDAWTVEDGGAALTCGISKGEKNKRVAKE